VLVEKAGRTQHSEMLRDGGPCQLEVFGNRPGRHFALSRKLNNGKPGLVAQRLELHEYSHFPSVLWQKNIDVRKN
jgi:hypothetical protein